MSRADLARRQGELLAALNGRRPAPAGFDRGLVRTAAASLRSKRARAVAKTWPRLARALGQELDEAMARLAAERPGPHPSGALGDGRDLALLLAAVGRLPWEGRLELLAVELRFRWPADGRRLPRRAGLVVARRGSPPVVVVGARLPAAGERWLHLTPTQAPYVLLR